MIGMVESKVKRGGKLAHERRYYLCSARLDAVTFARAVRAHWGVENRLHWVLDVVFDDELVLLCHKMQNSAIQVIRTANAGGQNGSAGRERRGVAFC